MTTLVIENNVDVIVVDGEVSQTITLIDEGPQGPPGPPGSGGDLYYMHIQSSPSATWTIAHNLGKYPSATIADSANEVVYGDIDYTDSNNIVVSFSAAFSGTAYLN